MRQEMQLPVLDALISKSGCVTGLLTLIEAKLRTARFDHGEKNALDNLVGEALNDKVCSVDPSARRSHEAPSRALCERLELANEFEALHRAFA